LIEAVKSQKWKSISLKDIKARDASWRNTEGLDAEMKDLLSSVAVKKLSEFEKASLIFSNFFNGYSGCKCAHDQ